MGVHVLHETKGICEKSPSSSSCSSPATTRMSSSHMRLWKSRSKSHSRLAISSSSCCWTFEGHGCWRNSSGQRVELKNFPLLNVTEVERLALQRLALLRLSEINLGCPVEVPKLDNGVAQETKKKPILLRKKAATTNFFDSKEKGSVSRRPVFGIPLSHCIANDRLRSRIMSEEDSAEKQRERQSHCEEVLSALRISHKNLSEESISSLKEGSQVEVQVDSSSTQQKSGSRRSISDFFSGDAQVPYVVKICIQFLENKALRTLGIFRVSGSQKRIRQLKEDVERNQNFAFDELTQPHDVAELLKEFFRDLPEPLLSKTLYRAFIAVQRIRDFQLRLKATRWLLYLLPVSHRDTLAALLAFLAKVTAFSEDFRQNDGIWVAGNKMDASNLATVFGPNLLRARKGTADSHLNLYSSERTQERSDVILTIRMLIENYETLFQVPPEDLDAIFQRLMVYDPQVLNVLLYRHYYNTCSDEVTVESSSYQSTQSQKISSYSESTEDTSEGERKFSQEIIESVQAQTAHLTEYNIKSRIRPLIFANEEIERPSLIEKQRYLKETMENYNNQKSSPRFIHEHVNCEPNAVAASFTVKLNGKNAAESSAVIPTIMISENDQDPSGTHKVRYGKYRHKTTPAFVTEAPISITIPLPKRVSNAKKYNQTEFLSIEENQGKTKDFTARKANQPVEKEKLVLRSVNMEEQISKRSPSIQERWKRREIIASEYVQF